MKIWSKQGRCPNLPDVRIYLKLLYLIQKFSFDVRYFFSVAQIQVSASWPYGILFCQFVKDWAD